MTTPTYSRGEVVFAIPPETNDKDIPITKTKSGKIGKHPVILLSVNAATETVTGVMLQTFNGAADLDATHLDATLYKWFLPVDPAKKESIHDPIPARPGSLGKAEWVNLKDVVLIGEENIKKVLGDVPASTLTDIEAAIVAAHK
ncbi:hypothetical protein JB92DRAFT_2987700 [Gautieria morchelliformis]|nr:hypothetical protein JB92DRAFT_2987700 [Gautieria morchelliformis]